MDGLRGYFENLSKKDFKDGKYEGTSVLKNEELVINLAEECYRLLDTYFEYNFIYNKRCANNARICFWNKTEKKGNKKYFPDGNEVSAGLYFNDKDPGEYLFFQVGLNPSVYSEKVQDIDAVLDKQINGNQKLPKYYEKYKLNTRNGNKEIEFEAKKLIVTEGSLENSIAEAKDWLNKVAKIYYNVFNDNKNNLPIKVKQLSN